METKSKTAYRKTSVAKASENVRPEEDLIELGAICPYYQRDRGQGRVYCECARFRFPDKEARREIVYTFCAHHVGYKMCPIKMAMDHFYERKYEQIEKQEQLSNGGCEHA